MTARDVQHRISELLDERGWSPTHLAKVVGVPTSTITDIFKRDSWSLGCVILRSN
ncbi:helix-turn-helix domain-containing protein [Butyrivibrio sp. WCD3002]|uniref:helix-turn-helix domain-containing protein n=1 Tax=Butyrivibrio sp. WCD3002 TaxID=1280676 RepID=UPI0012DC73B6|nr:helix-turn-helix transcriptional regulator [Butyrivibrio sp. WCD3002]